MANDIHKRVRELYRTFSKGYKRIANLVLYDYNSIVSITSKEFARKADVSESTVIRFAHSLGYSKYSDFQNAISDIRRIKATPLDNISSSKALHPMRDFSASVIKHDIGDLKWTMEHIKPELFAEIATAIIASQELFIIANEESREAASMLANGLRYSAESVTLITNLDSDASLLDFMRLNSNGTVIVIDFPPHTKRLSSFLAHISRCTKNIFVISDTQDSPACAYTSSVIVARTHPNAFTISQVSLLAVINAILADLARRNESRITDRIERLEALKCELNNNTKGLK